ncbi:Similar to S.cerevisiae protein MRPL39 (Mitochondrial ribosomal protein of the large subunit) [Malassezia sympodialis ATCC 42132]|uniref:Large ribosomal subunit protein bL33m n=1 Tax=Malassezia sympodialis (strain ATCC 42132) TaxID=1230383 RepID=A0A1M8A4N0_MALS4|nr:Similar to S.cerevisiae protein MRPL39 (Mitochondrial ribosomal protein of the large subunit) [Malassezia sympodialis ATCC 42132]
MAAKSKARVVIARLLSTAGSGYMYTTRRLRVADKLSMMKYDPIVKRHVLFKEVKGSR